MMAGLISSPQNRGERTGIEDAYTDGQIDGCRRAEKSGNLSVWALWLSKLLAGSNNWIAQGNVDRKTKA